MLATHRIQKLLTYIQKKTKKQKYKMPGPFKGFQTVARRSSAEGAMIAAQHAPRRGEWAVERGISRAAVNE